MNRFNIKDIVLDGLLSECVTPLYVVSEDSFIQNLSRFKGAIQGRARASYASKANSIPAIVKLAYDQGFGIDIASEGEMRAALFAGVPGRNCHFHGNNKLVSELEFAFANGIGNVIVDNFEELQKLLSLRTTWNSCRFSLRLTPGVKPTTDPKISTGQQGTKFGFNISDGSAASAVKECLAMGLLLTGFHMHVGSQLVDLSSHLESVRNLSNFVVQTKEAIGFVPDEVNLGGGLGVDYGLGTPPTYEEFVDTIIDAASHVLNPAGIHPLFAFEPGRSLIAEAGVTLYTVGSVKHTPEGIYVSVDGGLSDNPRPAMYGAVYPIRRVRPQNDTDLVLVNVCGRHCETDLLLKDANLPTDIKAGDVLEVQCTGAYNASMASNYNRFLRPETVLVRSDGSFLTVQKRETYEEMFMREVPFA